MTKTPPILGAYYFSDVGVCNFWESFSPSRVNEELKVFKDDGFDTIFLVLPWAALQPTTSPITYNSRAFEHLDRIFDAAEELGLKVGLRLAFLWESTRSTDRTYQRLKRIFSQPELLPAWRDYFRFIHNRVKGRPNLGLSLLAWEDFYWPCYREALDSNRSPDKREFFRQIGFQGYLERRMPSGVPPDAITPLTENRELWYEYLLYWDLIVERLFRIAEDEFPQLGYEFRSDTEHITKFGGGLFYHYHRRAFSNVVPMTYYNQFTIPEPNLEQNFSRWLDLQDQELGRPVFISQFNFIDNSYDSAEFDDIRSFLGNRDMGEETAANFLRNSTEVLATRTSGYCFWAYRDVVNDCLCNSTFDRGLEGFDSGGDCRVVDDIPPRRCISLKTNGQIWQDLAFASVPYHDAEARVLVEGVAVAPTTLEIGYWGTRSSHSLMPGNFSISVPNVATSPQSPGFVHCVFVRCAEGEVFITRIALFNIVITNSMYDRKLQPRVLVEEVRGLNTRVRGLLAKSSTE